MNREQIAKLTSKFVEQLPLLRKDLSFDVKTNHVFWFDDRDKKGQCFYLGDWPAEHDEKRGSVENESCSSSQKLYRKGKRVLDHLLDPTADFKDNSLEAKGVRLLWFEDYWDGPLSGVCEWNDKKYWFSNLDPHLRAYHYSMREMDKAEWAARKEIHSLFINRYGTYRDYFYDDNGTEHHGHRKSQKDTKDFSTIPKTTIPISSNPISTWFIR